jgi:NAD(P)-dependent dehydrogenase (short-subunit alcohol dehydrogenase family)
VRTISGAALWGLGRTLSIEHPNHWGGLVDIDPAESIGMNADFVAREVMEADNEDMVAFRETQRYVPRLARIETLDVSNVSFVPRSDATYLLTGGLGGIALAVAAWLAAGGARHLLLVGRTRLPPREAWESAAVDEQTRRRIDAITALEAAGVRLELHFGDVAEAGFLGHLLQERRNRGEPPVAGAFHTAGTVGFVPLAAETPEGLEAMASAKLKGALELESALQEEPIEHLVLFSSTSTILRSPLLGAYAAANAALDALACRRSGEGRPALSINWGTWGEAGMVIDSAHGGRREMLIGIDVLSSAAALDALGRLMSRRATRATVMPVDWAAFADAYPSYAADPFLTGLTGGKRGRAEKLDGGVSATGLLAMPVEERPAIVLGYLRAQTALVLGFASDRLEVTEPLSSLGFDSLMAVQLKTRVEADLGVSLPMMSMLGGPSVEELTETVLAAMAATSPRPVLEVANSEETGEWEEGIL